MDIEVFKVSNKTLVINCNHFDEFNYKFEFTRCKHPRLGYGFFRNGENRCDLNREQYSCVVSQTILAWIFATSLCIQTDFCGRIARLSSGIFTYAHKPTIVDVNYLMTGQIWSGLRSEVQVNDISILTRSCGVWILFQIEITKRT